MCEENKKISKQLRYYERKKEEINFKRRLKYALDIGKITDEEYLLELQKSKTALHEK